MNKPLLIGLLGLPTLGASWWISSNVVTCQETWSYAGQRHHVPAHMEYWTEYPCIAYDKRGTCTATTSVQHSRWVPDKYFLDYLDGYAHTNSVEVGRLDYEKPPQTNTGDHWRWRVCPPQRGQW